MKTKFLTLVLALLWAVSLVASDTSVGGIWYNFNSDGTAEVTGCGNSNPSNDNKYTGAVAIPSSVTYNGKNYSVTSIEKNAFFACFDLTSITIPNSVTSIGDRAFYNCYRLTKTYYTGTLEQWCAIEFASYESNPIDYSKNLYINDVLQTQLNIPAGVETIGNYAFSNCSGLTSITIPNSVTSIGEYAFNGCSGLTSITIPNSVTSIGSAAFYGCSGLTSVTIPNSVTSIGSSAFSECTSLTSIKIPNSITNIGSSVFSGCSNLTSITIPNSVVNIGEDAFYGCRSLTSITIPNSVTSIEDCAFDKCHGLTSITIPNSVINIGEHAFRKCSNLASISIPNSVTHIGYNAFYDTPWFNKQPDGIVYAGKVAYSYKGDWKSIKSIVLKDGTKGIADYAFAKCRSLTSITIPNSVTHIGHNAFDGCSILTSITIPNSVIHIGRNAFAHCSSLTSITIPNSVTSINEWTFEGCSSLTSITIPNFVTRIGEGAFAYCSGLISIVIPHSVTSIEAEAFYECSSLGSITISDSVTYIGGYAFEGTPWLYFQPDGLVYIGSVAYTYKGDKSSVKSIILKEGTCVIAAGAFMKCSNLTSVTIPNSVTDIGDYAFNECSSLDTITLPSSIMHIGEDAFDKKVVVMVRKEQIERFRQMIGQEEIQIVPYFDPPTISDIQVKDITCLGYTVVCKVVGEAGLTKVQFPTWTTNKGQDDLQKDWHNRKEVAGTANGDEYSFRVNITDHKGESGEYVTHIYAYDQAGKRTEQIVPPVVVPKPQCQITDIQITDISCLGYTINCTVNCEVNVSSIDFTATTENESSKNQLISINNKNTTEPFTCRVNTADFRDYTGSYQSKIKVKDEFGNLTEVDAPVVVVPDFIRLEKEQILNLTNKGYTISCTIVSHYPIALVQYVAWTEENGMDDAPADWKENKHQAGKANGNIYTFDVKKMKHHNDCGNYKNRVYVSDEKGHNICVDLPDADVPCKK